MKKKKAKQKSRLDEIFKYPIGCVKCLYRGRIATKKADMSKLSCPRCGGKLAYVMKE